MFYCKILVLSLFFGVFIIGCNKPSNIGPIEVYPFVNGTSMMSPYEDTCVTPPENHFPQSINLDQFDWRIGRGVDPINGTRIVTVKSDRSSQLVELELWIVDLESGKQQLLFENADMASWGTNNWIAFHNYNDGQIWIIRPDGTEAKQITSPADGAHYLPRWVSETELLYTSSNTSINGPILSNLEGKQIDMFENGPDIWISNSTILPVSRAENLWLIATSTTSNTTPRIVLFDQDTREQEILIQRTTDDLSSFSLLTWLEEGKSVMWSEYTGIYSMDLESKEVILLKGICTDLYSTITASLDSQYILASRIDKTFLTGNKEYRDGYVVVIDIENEKEWRVNGM